VDRWTKRNERQGDYFLRIYIYMIPEVDTVSLNGIRTTYERGCIQKFLDCLPGETTANGTALCHYVQVLWFISLSTQSGTHTQICNLVILPFFEGRKMVQNNLCN